MGDVLNFKSSNRPVRVLAASIACPICNRSTLAHRVDGMDIVYVCSGVDEPHRPIEWMYLVDQVSSC